MKEIEGQLFIEDIPVKTLVTEYGTPLFIYSSRIIKENFNKYKDEIRNDDLICYAVKANSNLHILRLLAGLGSGFDVVSGNELKRCLTAGADKKKIVFSGVAKSIEEIRFAIESDILSINVESEGEFARIIQISEDLNKAVNCALRINPDISTGSHEYIETGKKTSKFGLDREAIRNISELAIQSELIKITTIASHIGSQISDESLILDSLNSMIEVAEELQTAGHHIENLDIGGGLGIKYKDENEGNPKILIDKVKNRLKETDYKIILEPGRSVVASSGILATKIEYIKEAGDKKFAIIDAGMNDLIRPSLYEAWHRVREVETKDIESETYDLAGPVCETGDVLAKDRELKILPDDYVVFMDVGAYGSVMASNYNSRLKPLELLVTGDKVNVIKRRESFEDLISLES